MKTSAGNVIFDYWLRFRLSEFVNFFGTLLSGYPAPFAIVRIRLTMRPSGDPQASFNSSFLPSQEFYVDWKSTGEYNMLSYSEQDFWNFIKVGERRNAPTAERLQTELKARVIHLRERLLSK